MSLRKAQRVVRQCLAYFAVNVYLPMTFGLTAALRSYHPRLALHPCLSHGAHEAPPSQAKVPLLSSLLIKSPLISTYYTKSNRVQQLT